MHPLAEYPRPAMRRDSYENLNGPWQYAITASAQRPAGWDGEILVPYAPECRASGVGRTLQPGQWLHYHRYFAPPAGTGLRLTNLWYSSYSKHPQNASGCEAGSFQIRLPKLLLFPNAG